MTIDEILAIPAGDWTEEQTQRVKQAVAAGEVWILRMPQYVPDAMPVIPPHPPTDPIVPGTGKPWWDLLGKGYLGPVDECSIARYFKENPDKTFVHMVCTCKRCTVYY